MKVAVLFDDVYARAAATADERGVLEAVDAVEHALGAVGHNTARVPVGERLAVWCARLEDARADLVFNLCEGVNGSSAREANAAAVVELLGLPMTGSNSATLALCRRKDHVNAILARAGLNVPAWRVIEPGPATPEWGHYPAIVKPAAEDASIGITQSSVVADAYELAAALAQARVYGPAVVQEYVAGRELNAALVGAVVLPLAEIDFTRMPAGAWPIVSYRAKWEAGSDEDLGTRPVCPALLGPRQRECVRAAATAAWRAVGGAGYGRVDFRLAEDDTVYVLEVNPNPDLAPGAGLTRMASRHGWSYTELITRLVAEALEGARAPVLDSSEQSGLLTARLA